MSTDGETPSPGRGNRNLLFNELATLLQSLRTLYTQITAKLWHRRLQPPEPSALAGDSADIAGSLSGHIERTAAEAEVSTELSPDADESMERSDAVRKKSKLPPASRVFSALSSRFKGNSGGVASQQLGEKMRADTMRHINKALRLAKGGDARGAKVHAELAENAMKTASQYLPEEEYRTFKQDVETQLKEIAER